MGWGQAPGSHVTERQGTPERLKLKPQNLRLALREAYAHDLGCENPPTNTCGLTTRRVHKQDHSLSTPKGPLAIPVPRLRHGTIMKHSHYRARVVWAGLWNKLRCSDV